MITSNKKKKIREFLSGIRGTITIVRIFSNLVGILFLIVIMFFIYRDWNKMPKDQLTQIIVFSITIFLIYILIVNSAATFIQYIINSIKNNFLDGTIKYYILFTIYNKLNLNIFNIPKIIINDFNNHNESKKLIFDKKFSKLKSLLNENLELRELIQKLFDEIQDILKDYKICEKHCNLIKGQIEELDKYITNSKILYEEIKDDPVYIEKYENIQIDLGIHKKVLKDGEIYLQKLCNLMIENLVFTKKTIVTFDTFGKLLDYQPNFESDSIIEVLISTSDKYSNNKLNELNN